MDRKTIIALLIGLVVGATSAAALSPAPQKAADGNPQLGTAWSADYAAIPHDTVAKEQPATF
jgi:hypothetical protein